MLICVRCGRNINEIGQDNMSNLSGSPICEDCYDEVNDYEFKADNGLEFDKDDYEVDL